MKKKVGILLRKDENYHLNKELIEWLEQFDLLPIGIVNDKVNDMKETTKLCDGIILQGGREYNCEEIEYIKYLYYENIPTLGICLGMQMMAVALNGKLDTLEKDFHKKKEKYVHRVKIIKDTKLFELIKLENINVNSRHKDYVKYTDLNISGISSDGIIEAIEDKNKKFFIGIQWHPESIRDINSNNLLKSFKEQL